MYYAQSALDSLLQFVHALQCPIVVDGKFRCRVGFSPKTQNHLHLKENLVLHIRTGTCMYGYYVLATL